MTLQRTASSFFMRKMRHTESPERRGTNANKKLRATRMNEKLTVQLHSSFLCYAISVIF